MGTSFIEYRIHTKFDMDEEIPPEEIENAYWRILENCEDSVEVKRFLNYFELIQVHYGSDLEVSSHGSGFPNTPDDLRNARFVAFDIGILMNAADGI